MKTVSTSSLARLPILGRIQSAPSELSGSSSTAWPYAPDRRSLPAQRVPPDTKLSKSVRQTVSASPAPIALEPRPGSVVAGVDRVPGPNEQIDLGVGSGRVAQVGESDMLPTGRVGLGSSNASTPCRSRCRSPAAAMGPACGCTRCSAARSWFRPLCSNASDRSPWPAQSGSETPNAKRTWIPAPVFLIEHPTAGVLLVDTGVHPRAAHHHRRCAAGHRA